MKSLEKEAQEYFENNIFCDGITEFEKDVCIKSFIAGYKWAEEHIKQLKTLKHGRNGKTDSNRMVRK